jgi:hypothetical protein
MDPATGIAAIAAVGSAGGAIAAALIAWRALHGQAAEVRVVVRQYAEDRDRRLQEQAAKVSGWVAREDSGARWQARIRNQSGLPVYNVRTTFHEMKRRTPAPEVGPAWDVVDTVEAPRDFVICVLPPDDNRDVPVPQKVREEFGRVSDRTCVISITFTDAAGNHWGRNEHGILRQIPEPSASVET